jgi:hypothetical protein
MQQLELFEEKPNKRFGFYLDYEMIDRITVAGLIDYLEGLEMSLHDHRENGAWMHSEDVTHTEKMIEAIKFVLRDFEAQEFRS